jgi:UDP-N-acetylmuramate: L-alanyl-gamma-D-glutamyl-meso-diaminopimelate ligase
MHLHILGIGGTFMAGVALLARSLGHRVTGCDAKVYPPMSTQLVAQGVSYVEGYEPSQLEGIQPDVVVIGNALSRGNPLVEAVLERGLAYTSGAQWLAEHVLHGRWVLAVAGTHGKTITTSLLAWILEHAGLAPGFLVGGVPENFGVSARLGDVQGRTNAAGKEVSGPGHSYFVVEADEYDTAFFDKRSKFVHYRPRTLVLNNLEDAHADIFPDIQAIERQFHHLLRTVPPSGRLIVKADDRHLASVLAQGCWSEVEHFAELPMGEALAGTKKMPPAWLIQAQVADGSRFRVFHGGVVQGDVQWGLIGSHNLQNALSAIAAAHHVGVPVATALEALSAFRNVKRRLEVRGVSAGVTVYDDFAHHPTAIATTLEALRAHVGNARIHAVLEPGSNTMRMGVHRDTLGPSLVLADRVYLLRPAELGWNLDRVTRPLEGRARAYESVEAIVEALAGEVRTGDHVLVMSNGGFGNIHQRLLERLAAATL